MIYFNNEHEAVADLKTLQQWGQECVYQCEDNIYAEFLQGKYIWQDDELVLNPDYEQEQAEKERARLDALTLTPADVYKGLALAKNIMPEQLKALLPKYITDPIQLASCLVDLDYAKDFYRVHPLFNMTENISEIGITPTQWDKFFESKDYKDLLPIIEEVETEPETENQEPEPEIEQPETTTETEE